MASGSSRPCTIWRQVWQLCWSRGIHRKMSRRFVAQFPWPHSRWRFYLSRSANDLQGSELERWPRCSDGGSFFALGCIRTSNQWRLLCSLNLQGTNQASSVCPPWENSAPRNPRWREKREYQVELEQLKQVMLLHSAMSMNGFSSQLVNHKLDLLNCKVHFFCPCQLLSVTRAMPLNC